MNNLYDVISLKMKLATNKAYSITELSIVLIIIGIIMSASFSIAITQTDAIKEQQTLAKINTIEKALYSFVAINKRLPCPADASLDIRSNASYGDENCTGTVNFNVTIGLPSLASNTIVIGGTIPVSALFLPKDFMLDGWGNKFTYAVSKGLADSSIQNPFDNQGEGVIKIMNINNTAQITNAAAYLIISHGKLGTGAWVASGSKKSAGSDTKKIENSHSGGTFNGTFVLNTINSQGSSTFDDILLYRTRQQIVTNAGFTFSGTVCNNAYLAIMDNYSSTSLASKLCNGTGGTSSGTASSSSCNSYLIKLGNLIKQRCIPR